MNKITRDHELDILELGERAALALTLETKRAEEARARTERIAGLRALADLLEQTPDLPVPASLRWEFAGATVHQAADAVTEARLPSSYVSRVGVQRLNVDLPGLSVVFTAYPQAVTA
jgi:hypothetical protein